MCVYRASLTCEFACTNGGNRSTRKESKKEFSRGSFVSAVVPDLANKEERRDTISIVIFTCIDGYY